MSNTAIGKKIKQARKQAGLTQKQFGEHLGKSGATIAYIEQGQRRVNAELLNDVSKVLQRPLSFFYEDGSSTDIQLKQQLFALNKQLDSIQSLLSATEQQKEAAEADSQLFRKLLDHCNDIIAVWDPVTGQAIDCNQKTCDSLGYRREEFLQKKIMEVEPGIPTLDIWKACVKQARKMGFIIIETYPIGKDGMPGHVEVNVKYVSIDQQDYMVVVAREMTERKRHEEMAKLQSEKYNALLESSGMGVMTCDNQGEVLEVNEQLYDMLDIPRNLRQTQVTRKILASLDKAGLFSDIQACLKGGKTISKDLEVTSNTNEQRSFAARLVPMDYTGYITGVQVVIENIA